MLDIPTLHAKSQPPDKLISLNEFGRFRGAHLVKDFLNDDCEAKAGKQLTLCRLNTDEPH